MLCLLDGLSHVRHHVRYHVRHRVRHHVPCQAPCTMHHVRHYVPCQASGQVPCQTPRHVPCTMAGTMYQVKHCVPCTMVGNCVDLAFLLYLHCVTDDITTQLSREWSFHLPKEVAFIPTDPMLVQTWTQICKRIGRKTSDISHIQMQNIYQRIQAKHSWDSNL